MVWYFYPVWIPRQGLVFLPGVDLMAGIGISIRSIESPQNNYLVFFWNGLVFLPGVDPAAGFGISVRSGIPPTMLFLFSWCGILYGIAWYLYLVWIPPKIIVFYLYLVW